MPSWRAIILTTATVALLPTLLVGCKTVVSSRVCPPLQNYSTAFKAELTKEFAEVVERYPHVAQVVRDYDITRDDIRDCLNRTHAR
jgi:hypothetical protein